MVVDCDVTMVVDCHCRSDDTIAVLLLSNEMSHGQTLTQTIAPILDEATNLVVVVVVAVVARVVVAMAPRHP